MPLIPSIHGSMCQMVPRKTEEESKEEFEKVLEEFKEELINFYKKLESEQINIPAEYAEIMEKHGFNLNMHAFS